MAAVTLSYAPTLAQSLNELSMSSAIFEARLNSVERMKEYDSLPREAEPIIPENRPPQGWPFEGSIKFSNYCMRYRPGAELVLKNINAFIKPREKIGIVGRTGAGT